MGNKSVCSIHQGRRHNEVPKEIKKRPKIRWLEAVFRYRVTQILCGVLRIDLLQCFIRSEEQKTKGFNTYAALDQLCRVAGVIGFKVVYWDFRDRSHGSCHRTRHVG